MEKERNHLIDAIKCLACFGVVMLHMPAVKFQKEIIDILSRNNNASIINIIKYSYFYISIVILYFLLKNRYGYSYLNTSNVINNNYLYASLLIVILLFIINYF